MARINFVVPPLDKHRFSGGIWCILQYVKGLSERGHAVNVIPMLPSERPEWIRAEYGYCGCNKGDVKREIRRRGNAALRHYIVSRFVRTDRARYKEERAKRNFARLLLKTGDLGYEIRKGVYTAYLRGHIPEADATVATLFETVLPTYLYGTGRKYYFMQAFEVLFAESYRDSVAAFKDADGSYRLGLERIANSSWLKSQVEGAYPGATVSLCPNAINHEIFSGEPRHSLRSDEVRVISFGGRDLPWKGFREMAEAMKIARASLARVNIRWLVYGDALLPPDNPVASYEPLGFLHPERLVGAYRDADVLFSASWFESFPLFPLEAMACGLPVVTTALGTEDYAIPGDTAEVVVPRDPENIANGLIRVIKDNDYRRKIAFAGKEISKEFTWERSVQTMERILLGHPAS